MCFKRATSSLSPKEDPDTSLRGVLPSLSMASGWAPLQLKVSEICNAFTKEETIIYRKQKACQ